MAKKAKQKFAPPYPAPPIIECVMELRFKAPANSTFVEKAARRIAKFYEHRQTQQLVAFEVRVDGTSIQPIHGVPTPVERLSSTDETDRCIVQVDKVYWSQLPPYPGWEGFLSRVDRDLAAFGRLIAPMTLARIGLRYRNRIDVPLMPNGSTFRHADFFKVGLDLPTFFDPTSSFEWKVRKDFPDRDLSAVVISGVVESPLPHKGAVMLDIDVFANLDVTIGKYDIRKTLENMRDLKNEIFEQSITDRARESFQ